MSKLIAELTRESHVWHLKLKGDLEGRAYHQAWLADLASQAVEANVQTLIVELKNIENVDSRGLKFLLDVYNEFSSRKIEVVLRNPSNHLRRLFRIIQFERIFKIEDESAEE